MRSSSTSTRPIAGRGAPLFPGDARKRALIRRLILEADNYFDKAIDPIVDEAFAKKPEERDPARLAKGKEAVVEEYALFARAMRGEFLAGPLSAADYALYPLVAFLDRCVSEASRFRSGGAVAAAACGVEGAHRGAAVSRSDDPAALEAEGMTMKLTTTAFPNHGAIPGEFAFAVIDPATHVKLSANRNPDFAWTDVPAGTRSLALVCHDPDVPSRGDDVNQEGREVPASLPRVDFFHWALIDLETDYHGHRAGRAFRGRDARGKPGPQAPRDARHGINDYTGWFAGDAEMGGDYFGYDGPCPPWNDAILHRYVFTLYALDVARLDVSGRFTGADVRRAMQGHILAQASVTGRYTLNPTVKY